MKNKIAKIIFFLISFSFFFIIKSFNYDRYPLMGHLEEYAYSWMGIHLIESGVPKTWSPGGVNPLQDIAFSGKIANYGVELWVDILAPWLDLPPLYGLLSGGIAHILGFNKWSFLPASAIRLPAIIFSFLTTVVLFLLVEKLFDFKTALFSCVIYSLTPLFVFSQRLSVAENGITFLYILGIYLTILYLEKPRWYYLFLLSILPGIAGLMKQTGFFLCFLEIFLLAKNKLWKEAIFIFFGIFWFLGVLSAYGWAVDWNLFKNITLNQSRRPVGFMGLPFIFSTSGFSIEPLYDGWYIFSLLSAFYLSVKNFKKRNYHIIALAFIFWLMVVVFSGGQGDMLLWYRYPALPFIAIFGALMLIKIIKNPNLFTSIIILGMLLTGRVFLSNDFRPITEPFKFRLITFLLLLPAIFYSLFKKPLFKKINKIILIGVVVAGLFLNTKAIYSVFTIVSASKTFPIGPGNFLSEIHLPILWRVFLVK